MIYSNVCCSSLFIADDVSSRAALRLSLREGILSRGTFSLVFNTVEMFSQMLDRDIDRKKRRGGREM